MQVGNAFLKPPGYPTLFPGLIGHHFDFVSDHDLYPEFTHLAGQISQHDFLVGVELYPESGVRKRLGDLTHDSF